MWGASQLKLKMSSSQIEVFLLFKKLSRCVPVNWNNLMISLSYLFNLWQDAPHDMYNPQNLEQYGKLCV